MPKLCLNMIVKNESGRILRALSSAVPHITCAVIHDTGSTDGTQEMARDFLAKANIPCKITDGEFKDFSYARNAGLQSAWSSGFDYDYLLLFDADMELKVLDPSWLDHIDAPAYCMFQHCGSLWYQNARLMRADQRKNYISPTHEYLDVPPDYCIPKEKAFFEDYADGANRPEKFKRDIKLLKGALEHEPKNGRYMYYLAQSYADGGQWKKAAKWYRKRVKTPGWDEEIWHAQYRYAACLRALGDEDGFVAQSLIAYNMRPTRTEPLHDLAKYYREKGWNFPGAMIAEAAMDTPPSNDPLFVNDHMQTVGNKNEFAICGFYVPWRHKKAFATNNWLALYRGPYSLERETARANMYHYIRPLIEFCPSFKWKSLTNFTPPNDYIAMNPSIARGFDGKLAAIIRTVNYRMDEHGRYLIRATDGTANNTNPIHTRNFFVSLDDNLEPPKDALPVEIIPPRDWALHYRLVVGAEDMRLYPAQTEWWASTTNRQGSVEGYARQHRMRLDFRAGQIESVDWREMKPQTNYEKNWMPICNGKHDFLYRADTVVNGGGEVTTKLELSIDVGVLSGGTQLIWTGKAWLGIVHEARNIPGASLRYYAHRFIALDEDFRLRSCTLPFYFNEKVIEYAAGLTLHPDGEHLVISYGFKDCEARFGTVKLSDVEKYLWVS